LGQTIRNSLKYQWNFGDLHTATSAKPTYTYLYPGTYNVFVEASFTSYFATARQEVTVLPLTISLSHTASGDVLLHNDAMYEVDISGYYLTASKSKKIPPHTYLSPRETITIPWRTVAEASFPTTFLLGRDREVIVGTSASPQAVFFESAPAVSTLSATTNTPAVASISPEDSERATASPAFGFASASTQTSEASAESAEELDEVGLTPLVSASATSSSPSYPLTNWWVYGAFVLLLSGAVAGLFLRRT